MCFKFNFLFCVFQPHLRAWAHTSRSALVTSYFLNDHRSIPPHLFTTETRSLFSHQSLVNRAEISLVHSGAYFASRISFYTESFHPPWTVKRGLLLCVCCQSIISFLSNSRFLKVTVSDQRWWYCWRPHYRTFSSETVKIPRVDILQVLCTCVHVSAFVFLLDVLFLTSCRRTTLGMPLRALISTDESFF